MVNPSHDGNSPALIRPAQQIPQQRSPDASVWFRTLSIPNQQRVYCSFIIMLVICAFLLPSAIPAIEGEPSPHSTKPPDHASRVDDEQSSPGTKAFAAICGVIAPVVTCALYVLALNLRRSTGLLAVSEVLLDSMTWCLTRLALATERGMQFPHRCVCHYCVCNCFGCAD